MAKVLIVEDDQQISAMIGKMLDGKGYYMHVESNGAAALLTAHEEKPDIILMDLDLKTPILDVHESIHALRHDEKTAHIPILVFSAIDDDRKLSDALTAGANSFIVKRRDSSDIQELLSLIERLVTLQPKDAASS